MNIKKLINHISNELCFTVWNCEKNSSGNYELLFSGIADGDRREILEYVNQFYGAEFSDNQTLEILI